QCARARKYLEEAAQGADERAGTLAMLRLAGMHAASREHEKALEWYLKAAQRGSALARFKAAEILMGHRARHDPALALELLSQSAAQGFPEAYRLLGAWDLAAGRGRGGGRKAALSFFQKGCAMGDRISCSKARLLQRLQGRDAGRLKGFSSLASDAASRLFPKSSPSPGAAPWTFAPARHEAGAAADAPLARGVALMCADAGDEERAAWWMRKGAMDGDARAMLDHALWLMQGIASSGSEEWRIWLQRAASLGNLDAQRTLAMSLCLGHRRWLECPAGIRLLENAAGRGDPLSLLDLGAMKALGCGAALPPDASGGLGILRRSCAMGLPQGCRYAEMVSGSEEEAGR
ncbi:MAG: hypothetical protein ACI4NA_03190, partial [Succinivibrio sp.]